MQNKPKIIILTGCLGFIGGHLTRACLNRGWYVRGIDKISYCSNFSLLKEFEKYPRFTFEKTDINDLAFLPEHDYLINTCAESHVANSIINSDEFMKSNVMGVHHLLNLLRDYRPESGVKPILIELSSDEVMGDLKEGSFTEKDILNPSNPYSASKAAADMLVLAYHRTYGIPYIITRMTNNWGTHQYPEKLIPKTVKYLDLGKKIPLHNGGTPIRTWLHVEDCVDAILTLIDSGVKNEIFNISGHYEQTNLDTVLKIIRAYYYPNLQETANSYLIEKFADMSLKRQGQDCRYSLNDDKIQKLGWHPKRKFDEELPRVVEFYRGKFVW